MDKSKSEQWIHIAYQGLQCDESQYLSSNQMEQLAQQLNDFIAARKNQKEYGNSNPCLFFISPKDFPKDKEIDLNHLQALVRYLILKDNVYSYAPNPNQTGFCIYLDQIAHHTRNFQLHRYCYTKQQLEMAAKHIDSLVSPPLAIYKMDEQSKAKNIINLIKLAHYDRIIHTVNLAPCSLNINLSHYPFLYHFMDELVKSQWIHSWNAYNHDQSIVIKLNVSDSDTKASTAYHWKTWRDKQEIAKGEQFRKENSVSISDQALQDSNLTLEEKDILNKLIANLNMRVQPGVYILRGHHKGPAILDFLKTQKAIFDYKKNGWSNDYSIYVKETDKPSTLQSQP